MAFVTKRTLDYACFFANWCRNNKLDPVDVKELAALVLRRAGTATRCCNEHDETGKYKRADQAAINAVRKKAESMKLVPDFGVGLYTIFSRKGSRRGEHLHLPLDV